MSDKEIIESLRSQLDAAIAGQETLQKEYNKVKALEVVRCKDCEHFMEYRAEHTSEVKGATGDCYLRIMHSNDKHYIPVKPDGFCSDGIKEKEKNE